ncbi:hypothetical protein [Sphingomonas oleivorans]|nr:hypothetical protein [Sphingomonas oleivorans]
MFAWMLECPILQLEARPTLYGRIGNLFGCACVAAMSLLLAWEDSPPFVAGACVAKRRSERRLSYLEMKAERLVSARSSRDGRISAIAAHD